RHVLGDHDRYRQERKDLKDPLQRGRAAGRTSDGDELDGRRGGDRDLRLDLLTGAVVDALAQIVHPNVDDLPHLGHEIVLNFLEPGRDATSSRLGNEVDRSELEGLEDAAVTGA